MSWRGVFDGMTQRERWKRGTAACSCGVQSGKRLKDEIRLCLESTIDSVNGRGDSELRRENVSRRFEKDDSV